MEQQFIPNEILEYCDFHSSPLGELPETILSQAKQVARGHMMVGTHVGRLLQCLVLCRQPKLMLEIGTFHGFSAAAMVEVLPHGSKLICCERDTDLVKLASKNLERTNVEILECDGIDYLKRQTCEFEFIFVDAEKDSFCREIDVLHDRLAKNGILVIDNALAGLAVLRDEPEKGWEKQTKSFNSQLRADSRFFVFLLPLRDGITIAVKR